MIDKEKLERRIRVISSELEKFGVDLYDELLELIELKKDIGEEICRYKLKKVNYFHDEENNKYVGFTLDETQVLVNLEFGEDEDGPWYDTEFEILRFSDDE